LLECAQIINHDSWIAQYKLLSIDLAVAASRGLDGDGGLWYEYETANDSWIKEKHSWPQAEAIVGFLNVWELTQNVEWLDKACATWNFVNQKLKDRINGEWYWGITQDGNFMDKEKAGFWKCPYHGVRACLEVGRRANALTE
jgi:mannobiose 2-epimerase